MTRSEEAAVVRELVRLAELQIGAGAALVRSGARIAEKMAGRPRHDAPIRSARAHEARARKMAGIPMEAY